MAPHLDLSALNSEGDVYPMTNQPTERTRPAPGARPGTEELRRMLERESGTATTDALRDVDRCLHEIHAHGVPEGGLIDLGCSFGTLGSYVASSLGIDDVSGVDVLEKRLARAASIGVRTLRADLTTDLPLPLETGRASIVTSFGAIEHLLWFDDVLIEAHRLLRPGGWLLISMPNLGSYVNRLALLAGYQPRDVEIARSGTPGILPTYRSEKSQRPVGHPHAATLRAMRELLAMTGFEVLAVHGFAPHSRGVKRLLDAVFDRLPALSRRVLILARRGDGSAPPSADT
jgi:SAM-dependent methyltransferase